MWAKISLLGQPREPSPEGGRGEGFRGIQESRSGVGSLWVGQHRDQHGGCGGCGQGQGPQRAAEARCAMCLHHSCRWQTPREATGLGNISTRDPFFGYETTKPLPASDGAPVKGEWSEKRDWTFHAKEPKCTWYGTI